MESEHDRSEIARLIEDAGLKFIVEPIHSLAELRSALKEPNWDVMICDYQSNSVGVAQVLDVLWESGRDIPCIVLAGPALERLALAAIKSGARDYVTARDMIRLVPIIQREVADVQSRRDCLLAIASLRDSEQRLRLALAASQTGIWQWDLRTDEILWSPECLRVLQRDTHELNLPGFLNMIHPDDANRVMRASRKAIETGDAFSAEFRIILPSNEVRWISNVGKVKFDESGRPVLLVSTLQDTTDHVDAKERLTEANQEMERYSSYYQAILGRLHSIREQERGRLAREIHDELGQSLTSLKLNAHAVMRSLQHGDTAGGMHRVQRFVDSIDELMQSVRDIASELRPAVLDQFGLGAALEWQCNLLRKQHGFDVTVQVPAAEPKLSDTQKITLFRIAQESLTNVMRHSGTQAARVSLEVAGTVCLTVSDNGSGAVNDDQSSPSLGIMGMRERARLIGADFVIEGRPGIGTTVVVKIPHEQVKGGRSEEKSATSG